MSNRMKRRMAVMLAAFLALQSPLGALAPVASAASMPSGAVIELDGQPGEVPVEVVTDTASDASAADGGADVSSADSETSAPAADGEAGAPSADDETSAPAADGEAEAPSTDGETGAPVMDEENGAEVPAASPSDAQAVPETPDPEQEEIPETGNDGIMLMSMVAAGSLRIELNSVVQSPASYWTVELISDSGIDSRTDSIVLPQVGDFSEWLEDTEAGGNDGGEGAGRGVSEGETPSVSSQGVAQFDELQPGTYKLVLTPEDTNEDSYLPYEQESIKIEPNRRTTLRLMNDLPEDYGYDKTSASKFGLLLMGDIDGDGDLDEDDQAELLRLAAVADSGKDDHYYEADLNGDAAVNLLDVVLFARYLRSSKKQREASPIHTVMVVPEDIIPVATESNAKPMQGSVADTFAGTTDAPLQLQAFNEDGDEIEEISEAEPLSIATEFASPKVMAGLVIDPVPGSENSIQDGEITVTIEEDGKDVDLVCVVEDGKVIETKRAAHADGGTSEAISIYNAKRFSRIAGASLLDTDDAQAQAGEPVPEGARQGRQIEIDLGGQVPVKKITIKVTKTVGKTNLVDISKVEYFGDMADRIPEPEMSIPEIVSVEEASGAFTIRWKKVPNVTGYRVVWIGYKEKDDPETAVKSEGKAPFITENELTVNGIGDPADKLKNDEPYDVYVYAVNGDWQSQPVHVTATPRTSDTPPAPENIEIDGGFRRLSIRWKAMKDTDRYTVYYALLDENGKPVSGYESAEAEKNSLVLEDLEEDADYDIYLTGTNDHLMQTAPDRAVSAPSLHYTGRTTSLNPPDTPKRMLINKTIKGAEFTEHIIAVDNGTISPSGNAGDRIDCDNAVADGRYDTAVVKADWDLGYHYGQKAPYVTFDESYKLDTIILVPDEQQNKALVAAKVNYWPTEDHSTGGTTAPARILSRTSNGKTYYIIHTYEPIEARTIQVAVATGNDRRIGIAEMLYYHYDSLEHDILDMFNDNYHVTLKPEVNEQTIADFRARLEEVDPETGEYHMRKDDLEKELDNAEKILKEGALQVDILVVDNKDAMSYDEHITFRSGLNTYQPLGIVANAGEKLTIYVGGPRSRYGDSTRLQLVATQYHGGSAAWFKNVTSLRAGINEITVPSVDSMKGERGGQLYIEYTGGYGSEEYGVRVVGGHKSAVLDLSDVMENETEKLARAKKYVEELLQQDAEAETLHAAAADGDFAANHDSEYTPGGNTASAGRECIYQATDILTRYHMVSSAAHQILAGLSDCESVDAKAAKLVRSLDALDEMTVLFYQHKGLNAAVDTNEAKNRMPVSRLNIRYQRMFAGAFMYAGGKHIGIEWPELPLMTSGVPMETDENGKKIGDGKYFGWGIAHEIGHIINEGAYAVAEVTNNYFAILAQSVDTRGTESVRFDYADAYRKVTSGTKGKANNVFLTSSKI